jgi:dihydroorotate dehydrogenase (fumarate)
MWNSPTGSSPLLRHGPEHLATMERQLVACLTQRELASATELRGSLRQETVPDPAAFERANYMRTLLSWSTPGR